jgi:Post-segregation antitoxin CcdA
MAKRKITVTVDDSLIEDIEAMGITNLSSVVNAALAAELHAVGHRLALQSLLDDWDLAYGPVESADLLAAQQAFAELDAAQTNVA